MKCNICPRKCNIDRDKTRGYCGSTDGMMIARAALHMWEEECISGTNGSGTIFFSGCNLKCVFCQNHEISRSETGRVVSEAELADIMLELQHQEANNINLVTPSHFVPQICEAIRIARDKGLTIPIVYNSSLYETVETIKMLDGLVDIYLPDFKYYDDAIAIKYSNAPDYCDIATKGLDEMVRQCGTASFDDRGMMLSGIIVRHLVLPGHTSDSKRVLKHLHDRYGDRIYISIMNQFTPVGNLDKYPEINRKITDREYNKVVDYALDIGIEKGFIQEGDTAKESFIPPFGDI